MSKSQHSPSRLRSVWVYTSCTDAQLPTRTHATCPTCRRPNNTDHSSTPHGSDVAACPGSDPGNAAMQHRPTSAAADAALSTSCSAILGQKAFSNYNGLVTGLVYCPVAPQGPSHHPTSPAAAAAGGARGLPPPWLAIVVDASMRPAALQHAKEGIAQALLSLPPHTRLLLAVVDKVVSFVDLRSPQAPSWVLHSATSKASVALPHLVRAADIRATPLSHCLPHLPAALSAVRHYPHACTPQLHLHSIASALDIAIYLLTASMAAWDANQRSKADGGLPNYSPGGPATSSSSSGMNPTSSTSSSSGGSQPPHSARVLFLTDQQPRPAGPAAAAAASTPMDAKQQQHVQQLFAALGRKADNVDIPIDVITGSSAAPSWLPLQDTVISSRGTTLFQPHLAPPLASNLAALATKRVGWDGAIGFQLPRGVKLAELQGPIVPGHPLPVFYPGAQHYGSPAAAGGGGGIGPHLHGSSSCLSGAPAPANHAASGGEGGAPEGVTRASRSGVARAGAWPDNAVAVPALEAGGSFLVQLELGADMPPGSRLLVEAVAQWTDRAGVRQQQASQLQLSVASRRGEFLSGLHHTSALLLLARQLVEGALTAFQKAAGAGRPPAARRRVLEEAGLRVGMQLALMAQRLGEAHTLRRGLLGWGSQQVWQLPDELVPMAVALYLLQHGPLLGARRPLLFHPRTSSSNGSTGASSSSIQGSSSNGAAPLSSSRFAAGVGAAAAAVGPGSRGEGQQQEESEEEEDPEAAWQLQVYQLLDASPEAAVRIAAPEVHVYEPASAGFHRVLPVSLALTPSALVVVDCGTQLVVYAGAVIRFSNPGGTDGGVGGSLAVAGGAAEGSSAAAAGGGEQLPDVAMVAAPAVQLAQQLAKGRLPVPSIHILETEDEVDQLLSLLVPLHLDPMPTQLLLLPDLRDRSAGEHGQLLQWHKQRHERQVAAQEALVQQAAEVPSLDEWCTALRVALPVDHEGVASLQLS